MMMMMMVMMMMMMMTVMTVINRYSDADHDNNSAFLDVVDHII